MTPVPGSASICCGGGIYDARIDPIGAINYAATQQASYPGAINCAATLLLYHIAGLLIIIHAGRQRHK